MKVVCVNNTDDGLRRNSLTLGKIYDAINGSISVDSEHTTIEMFDDMGHKRYYRWDRFKRLEDIRQDKLTEVLQ